MLMMRKALNRAPSFLNKFFSDAEYPAFLPSVIFLTD